MTQGISLERRRGPGWSATLWVLGIIGGIATFLGLFILFGGEDDFVGFGGDWAWRVGDISLAWMYALLIGGLVLLLAAVTMIVAGRRMPRVETTPLADLLFHAGVFVFVNSFVWIQDFAIGGGLDYAYLMTIPWGIGLAIHTVSVFFGRRATEAVPEPTETEERKELLHH